MITITAFALRAMSLATLASHPLPSCPDSVATKPTVPFRITVDGLPSDARAGGTAAEDASRCQDRALERAGIQIRADGLSQLPVLNITPGSEVGVFDAPVRFFAYTNYATWITRYELRIFRDDQSTQAVPLAIVPSNGATPEFSWTPRAAEVQRARDVKNTTQSVTYVLRAYAKNGAFDETKPKTLKLSDRTRLVGDEKSITEESLVGYGTNSRSISNISVIGGAVTVSGDSLDPRSRVWVLGRAIPVAKNGRFATRQILPPGTHDIMVVIEDPTHGRTEFSRPVMIERNDWFSLALLDVTAGKNHVDGPAMLVTGDSSRRYSGETFVDGRLAFFVKGRIDGNTMLTASADTREQPVENLFTNFTAKDPLALLRRLDPNTYYPTYGDNSSLVEAAPTQGNMYFQIQHDDSHLLWGSFQTQQAGTDLVQFSRGLYGGELDHRSLATTAYGERMTTINAFAADPGTVGARDEFRGTGGSLYYLHNQDILAGSERVTLEVRDQDSHIVLSSSTLVASQDYEINALQGRITLREPLSTVADGSTLVRQGSTTGNQQYLVVTYEYTPGLSAVENMTTGGRVTQWIGDNIQIGATGYNQSGSGTKQQLLGGDVTLRLKPNTFVTVERAQSTGGGNGALDSQDGGYDFTRIPQVGNDSLNAMATSVHLSADLKDFSEGRQPGTLTGYYTDRGLGFSTPGQITNEAIRQDGFTVKIPMGASFAISGKGDERIGSISGSSRSLEIDADMRFGKEVLFQLGGRNDMRATPLAAGLSSILAQTGSRTDAIAKLGYSPVGPNGAPGRYGIYGLGQFTVQKDAGRTDNDRYGMGGHYALNNRVTLKGEVTDGTGGVGGVLGTDYKVTDRSSVYLDYRVDVDQSDQDLNGRTASFVTGGKLRYNDATSVFAERRDEHSATGENGIINAFGLDLAASDRWTWGARLEAGTTSDPGIGDLTRRSASLVSGYRDHAFKWGGALEYRTEQSTATGLRTSWLAKNTFEYQASRDWTMLGKANFAISGTGNSSSIATSAIVPADANYTEGVAGLAYRPVDNSRFNALIKYTYLYDQSSPGQLTSTLALNPYSQRSQVFSADGIYDISNNFSLGGKFGYREGDILDNSVANAPWTPSAAWLAIGRIDWHVVREWDAIAEYRTLFVREAATTRKGVLVGIYRHVTSNVKLGIGYNFTDYSDDLTDLSYRSRGFFINLLGVH
jgi:hypothetical protein